MSAWPMLSRPRGPQHLVVERLGASLSLPRVLSPRGGVKLWLGPGRGSTLENYNVNVIVMKWKVKTTDEAQAFLDGLTDDEFAKVDATIRLLQEFGPNLRRPHADSVYGSRHPNMKELRIKLGRREFRILFAFDPNREAILLVGGDKVGNKRWYESFIERADACFDQHLTSISKEKKGTPDGR